MENIHFLQKISVKKISRNAAVSGLSAVTRHDCTSPWKVKIELLWLHLFNFDILMIFIFLVIMLLEYN